MLWRIRAAGDVSAEKSASRIHVVGAAIVRDGRCLITQRGPAMSSPGKWEFPGGKLHPGEAAEAALAREIKEELNLDIKVGALLGTGTASDGRNRTIFLEVYTATIKNGSLKLVEHADSVWISAQQIDQFDWTEADRPILSALQSLLETA